MKSDSKKRNSSIEYTNLNEDDFMLVIRQVNEFKKLDRDKKISILCDMKNSVSTSKNIRRKHYLKPKKK